MVRKGKNMIVKLKDTENLLEKFAGIEDSALISCVQQTMGEIYGVEGEDSFMAVMGDYRYYAGNVSRELAEYVPEGDFFPELILIPQNDEWMRMLSEVYGERAEKLPRYGLKKDGDVFDRNRLEENLKILPDGYELRIVDEELFNGYKAGIWGHGLLENYPDFSTYEKYGLGVSVMYDGEPVAHAVPFSGYREGIEIQIETNQEHRRKGLAKAASSKLILMCLERGLYPSWDAANLKSLGLATQLGYHPSGEYISLKIKN